MIGAGCGNAKKSRFRVRLEWQRRASRFELRAGGQSGNDHIVVKITMCLKTEFWESPVRSKVREDALAENQTSEDLQYMLAR
jgi:hypothetical protein